MKILYDYQCFMQKYGGVSRYFAEIIHNLPKEIRPIIGIIFSENEYLNNYHPRTNSFFNKIQMPGKRTIYKYLGKAKCILYMLIGNYDILHVTADDTYFMKYNKKPFIVTIHDMIPELLLGKEQWVKEEWINRRKRLIYESAHIITISENTKKDILLQYPDIPNNKITVVYHGYNKNVECKNTDNIYGEYILYVGKRNSYKNFDLFIHAIARLLQENATMKLICTAPQFTNEEKNMIESLRISRNVIQVNANEETLTSLYKNATLFVFPSLYEGFGLPILEAWGNGCPILLSKKSCFPEIASDAVAYFSGEDCNELYEQITKLINSKTIPTELVNRGNERLKKFSWHDSALKIANVYQYLQLINKSK